MPAKSHGMSGNNRLYKIWANMKKRCGNPSNTRYADYGGRGITVCKRWDSFDNFLEDVGDIYDPMLTLDRINNNKGYMPSNVRWVSKAEQNQNSRRCVMVKIGKESKPINVWCREYGVPYVTFKQRRRNGWDIVKAVSTPPNPRHQRKET